MKFTLLMCIYAKDNPLHLMESFKSIKKQTVRPDEILIVKDGPLAAALEAVIYAAQEGTDTKWNTVQLPKNVTLGPARAAGVKAAKHEWIAIMDADDICRPDRFEKQLKMIAEDPRLGLIGGQISEFADNTARHSRIVPLTHDDIASFAKLRTPFNHMTVMFKREEVLSAGNYRLFQWFEDYDLWTRMIKNGTICANHPDILVDARVSDETYTRRRGLAYINSEWRLQKQLRTLGITNFAEFVRNTVVRIPVRLLPGDWLASLYRKTLRD